MKKVRQPIFASVTMTKNRADGFYEAPLPWKSDRLPLPDNKELALERLRSSTKRLEKIGKLQKHQIMKEQLNAGIIEPAPESSTGEVVHYIPHQPVIEELAESTKFRIVYDCSAQASKDASLLKDCLKIGPPLQQLLFDILLRNRKRPLCIIGDIKKVFLYIRLRKDDRDAQRLLSYGDLVKRNIEEFRFTRVIYASGPSPFILNTFFQKHVEPFEEEFPETTEALLEYTYVDDIQSGGDCPNELVKFKEESRIMGAGGFELHNWHSNVSELYSSMAIEQDDAELTYNDWTTGRKQHKTKILDVTWNKQSDKITIDFKSCLEAAEYNTKRMLLSAIYSIYDTLGLALGWGEILPEDIIKRCKAWIKSIGRMSAYTLPRCAMGIKHKEIFLHDFLDASKNAICVAIYVTTTDDPKI